MHVNAIDRARSNRERGASISTVRGGGILWDNGYGITSRKNGSILCDTTVLRDC